MTPQPPQPSPSPSPQPKPQPAPEDRVALTGPTTLAPAYGTSYTITGTANPGATVVLHLRTPAMAAGNYVLRSVTANAAGGWSRIIAATSDYRYFATAGTATTAGVLFRPAATVTGPRTRTLRSGTSCVLTGTAVPGTKVFLHLHTSRMAAGDYSLVQSVTADAHGAWTRGFRPPSDLGLYVAREENLAPHVVFQIKVQG